MLMTVDIGNTNVVVGLFRDGEPIHRWRISSDTRRMPDEYGALLLRLLDEAGVKPADVEDSALVSVVPTLGTTFKAMTARFFGHDSLVVSCDLDLGIRVGYENPREVGADRLCDAVAATMLHGPPAIVIDFGTATTFNAITSQGEYLGGAIAPGVDLTTRALFQSAAQLPLIDLVRPGRAIGRSMIESMQSGIILGYVGLVEGLVKRIAAELDGPPKVIATGGLAPLVARETPVVDIVDPDLTLKGLRLIYARNRPDHWARLLGSPADRSGRAPAEG